MAGSDGEWDRYERWNAAIAEVVYSAESAGAPVYLDLEDEVLDVLCDAAEPTADDPRGALVGAVKGTLVLGHGPADVLRGHLRRLDQWRRAGMVAPPPTLPLLAILSLAAENMHEGEGKAANNFYDRLVELLELSEVEKQRFTNAYRKDRDGRAVSTDLWVSVNDWLEMLEGNRGLPTAFALGHAHIGLPLSQALVRRTDREKLGSMFAGYGLAPHSSLPPDEMELLINEWLARTPCPASNSLERMWKRDKTARGRIIEVARLTLEAWDGPDEATKGAGAADRAHIDSVRIKALLRTFPGRLLELSLVLPARTSADVETLDVINQDGTPTGSLDLVPATSGWLGLADPSDIDPASLLAGEVLLRRQGQEQPLRRRPRRLIPMRRDDMLQAFVECERIQLGEDALVLVQSEIAPKVADLLAVAGRPGFTQIDSLPGLPDGWTVFDKVQILSSIPTELLKGQLVDLNLLQPLATSQVVLQGGLKLPGNIRKWSSLLPPELRASSSSGTALSARITCTRPLTTPPPVDRERDEAGAVLIWDLAAEHLPDGDYEISVIDSDGGSDKPEVLRLRSADNPAIEIDRTTEPIAHDPSAPGFGLIARRLSSPGAVRGMPAVAAELEADLELSTGAPGWYVARKSKPKAADSGTRVSFYRSDEKTCMTTGAHHMDLETALRGQSSVEGVCKFCGLVKRYPTRGRLKRDEKARSDANLAPRISVADLEPVREPINVDWHASFDALCHVGGGPSSALDRIAMQMEGSGLFGDTFARRLEALGHIEIERDPTSLRPISWEVVDPTLVQKSGGEILLIGFRSDRMMVEVEDFAHAARAEVSIDRDVDAPPVVKIVGLAGQDLVPLLGAIEESTHRTPVLSPSGAEGLAAMLPPLSEALEGLPSTNMTGARNYERWNPETARFEPAVDAGGPGAFRLRGFTRAYIYRRAADLGAMSALLGDARIVKYAAALDSGRSLIGYDLEAEVLYVPLGADLPGLYGRAATLASGRPPRENTTERLLEYRRVPPALAGRLASLLMS